IGPGFTDITTLPVGVQTAINQLAELGITRGTTPTTYNPGGLVTREQMASFLMRTVKTLGWTPEAT
ncbi:MAG: S-layer homology domain-containing protein, partial [Acidimicrobiia bacterium]|nr:S-layer homology domain-containing protein [Acidimicrobiia bacterium]